MRTASVIELSDEQRQQLQRWTRSSTVSVRLARRARIILLAEGMDNHQIASEVGVGRIQVGRWRKRFAQSGLSGIEADSPRGGTRGLGYGSTLSHLGMLYYLAGNHRKACYRWSIHGRKCERALFAAYVRSLLHLKPALLPPRKTPRPILPYPQANLDSHGTKA